jgi:hypothetical protein
MRALGGALVLLACVATLAWAGSDERKGTGGALELRLPVGPRGSALGSPVVADAAGVDAIFWNPSGLASMEHTEAIFSHTNYIADMKLNYAAVATHIPWGTLAVHAKVLSIGDIEVTTEAAPEGTGEIIRPTFSVMGVSLARQFTDRVLFGITTNFVREQVQSLSASAMSFDFGVEYITGYHGLRFGMVMKNFGPAMEFSGDNLNVNVPPPGGDPTSQNRTLGFSTASFEQPSFFTLAGSYDLVNDAQQRLCVLSSFQNNNFVGDNLSGGAEWTYRRMFSLRGSWFGTMNTPVDPVTGEAGSSFASGDDMMAGWAFGAGAIMKTGESNLGVDLAYRGVRRFFDSTLEMSIRLTF